MKRRHFVLGSSAALGGLALGWGLMSPRQRMLGDKPLRTKPGQVAFNGWLKIAADDSVTVIMAKSEMGQGVHTGLAMVLADELDADWGRVRVEHAPMDHIYNNIAVVIDGLPFHPDSDGSFKRMVGWLSAKTLREAGLMVTGGSSSIKDLWLPMRQAGASARAMLVSAAAQRWGVPADQIRVEAGVVHHPSGRRARFGELAAAAAQQPLPKGPQLKSAAQFKLIGKDLPRIEAAAKTRGKTAFGIDVLPEGLLYASVTMCPTLGGRVASFDGAAAARAAGVMQVLKVDGHHGGTAGVAVLADTPWHALSALKLLKIEWDEAVAAAAFSSASELDKLSLRLDQAGGSVFYSQGDVATARKGAAKTISADYRAPYLAHAALEPMNCTVQFKDGAATVWVSTQVPDLARKAVAQVLGIARDQVDVQVQFLGGGFGRRLEIDFIAQAAAIAKGAGGAPVQSFWSREEDTRHDFYRPAAAARFTAGLDAQGALVAWDNQSVGQSIALQALNRFFGAPQIGIDKTTVEGAYDQPYAWPPARIAHEIVLQPVPVGFWRSVGHSHQAFFKESFLDEVAHASGTDPVALRAGLLQQHPRALAVLQRVAALSGWGQPLPEASDGAKQARGVALHSSFGSVVAQVAEVSVAADKRIRVHRVFCVIDCGTPVNPNRIRQQMESGIVFGLGAALSGEIRIEKGRVQQSNFHDMPMLRMNECPLIVTEVMPSTAHPEGVGEPGVPPIAPAVANALFTLTGQRLRSLPLKLA